MMAMWFTGIGRIKAFGLTLDELRSDISSQIRNLWIRSYISNRDIKVFFSKRTHQYHQQEEIIPITDVPIALDEIHKNGLR